MDSETKKNKNLAAFFLNRSHPERNITSADIEDADVKIEETTNSQRITSGVREIIITVKRGVDVNTKSPLESDEPSISNFNKNKG